MKTEHPTLSTRGGFAAPVLQSVQAQGELDGLLLTISNSLPRS